MFIGNRTSLFVLARLSTGRPLLRVISDPLSVPRQEGCGQCFIKSCACLATTDSHCQNTHFVLFQLSRH